MAIEETIERWHKAVAPGNAKAAAPGNGDAVASGGGGGKFRYTKQILSGNHAMLEFETEMDGKVVNGVDIISCDDEGRIVEFKVMIRPLNAIQAVHAQMARMLESMKG